MEKYVNSISVEWIRKEFSKALFLGFGRFGENGDWSKVKTSYDYSDKAFSNEMFSKNGHLYFYDMLVVIHHL